MSGAFSFGQSKKETNTQQQSDPWDVATPYITDFLSRLNKGSTGVGQVTQGQTDALTQLEENAKAGNPYAGQIDQLATDMFGTKSRAGTIDAGYDALKTRLDPVANGDNVRDFMSDPQLQQLLQTVGNDVATRVNSQFAGAGRDLSGKNQGAIARGVTSATAPILVEQLNRERGRTDAAARDLFDASGKTAAGTTAADQAAAALRAAGIDVGDKALAAKDYGAGRALQIEELKKKLPVDELSWLAEMLYGAGGLGSQSSGTSTTKGQEFKFGADKIGVGSALSALFPL